MADRKVRGIIEKWYQALGFPKVYDREFYELLEQCTIPGDTAIDAYDIRCEDGPKNLLSCLYMCEALERFYQKKGISRQILLETLQDLVKCTVIWTDLKGKLHLGELGWLKNHLHGSIFNLGRLQFNMAPAEQAIPEKGIRQGEPVVEIHIPGGIPLTAEGVDASFRMAEEFLPKYFPEYTFRYYTCHSWLFDPTLRSFLKPGSNILAFQDRFEMTIREASDRLLLDVFGWDATRENLTNYTPRSGFAAQIKESVLSGTVFYEVTGVIEK